MLLALTTTILTIFQPVALSSLCSSCSIVEQVELITGTLAIALDERPILPSSWNLSPVSGAQLCASNGTSCFTDSAPVAPVVPVLEESTPDPAYGLPPWLEATVRQGLPWLDQAGQLFQPVVDALAPALSSLHHHTLLQFGLFWTAVLLESFMNSLLVSTSLWDNRDQDLHVEEIQAKSAQAIGNIALAMAEFDSKVSSMLKQIEGEQDRLCTKMRATMLADMDACFAALNTRLQAEFDCRVSVPSTTMEPGSPPHKSVTQPKGVGATLAVITEETDQSQADTSHQSPCGSASEQPPSSAQSTQDETTPEDTSQTSMVQFSLQRWRAIAGYNPTAAEVEEGRRIRRRRILQSHRRVY